MIDQTTTNIIHRLKRIEQAVGEVAHRVETQTSCLDVINHIDVIQAALREVNALILDRHLHTYTFTSVWSYGPDE